MAQAAGVLWKKQLPKTNLWVMLTQEANGFAFWIEDKRGEEMPELLWFKPTWNFGLGNHSAIEQAVTESNGPRNKGTGFKIQQFINAHS